MPAGGHGVHRGATPLTFPHAAVPTRGVTTPPVTIDLPFAFTFYGPSYHQAWVATNGLVFFLALTTASWNAAIPMTATQRGDLLVLGRHVHRPEASVRTAMIGAEPNRRFVIEWETSVLHRHERRVGVNIVLHENGQILTQYRNLADDGREPGDSATLGIENAAGTVALRYSFNLAVLDPEPAVTSIRYRPPAG